MKVEMTVGGDRALIKLTAESGKHWVHAINVERSGKSSIEMFRSLCMSGEMLIKGYGLDGDAA